MKLGKPKVIEFDCEISNVVYESEGFNLYGCILKDENDDDFIDVISAKKMNSNIKFNKYGNITLKSAISLTLYETYKITGEELKDEKYGYQYKVISYETPKPQTQNELKLFLENILDSEEQANEILREYPNIIDLIIDGKEDEIDTSKLYNVGDYRIQVIINRIQDNYVLMGIISEFSPFGLSIASIRQLYKKYKDVQVIKDMFYNDPYKFLMKLDRIGFKRADAIILKKLPELKVSLIRMKAYIDKELLDNENSGHTIIKIEKLEKDCRKNIGESIKFFDDAINDERFVLIKSYIMRKEAFETEKYIAKKIIDLAFIQEQKIWEYDLTNINDDEEIILTDEQIKTIKNVLENNFSILMGAAGSGKTMSMQTLSEILDKLGKTALYLAPTGKASKVLSNYIGKSASTIHRGLGYNPTIGWGINEDNPLGVDIVIVDESSMIDIYLMENLLNGIDISRTKLLLVGDNFQLPSVGAGNISYNLINSKIFNINQLTKIFRYKSGGLAKVNTDIRNGKKFYNTLKNGVNSFGEDNDYIFIKTQDELINQKIISLYNKIILKEINYKDIVITMALNKGEYGAKNVNILIQNYLLKNTDYLNKDIYIEDFNNNKYFIGDIVMQIKNNYKVPIYHGVIPKDDDAEVGSVFNGNTGIIKDIIKNRKGKEFIIIDFDGQEYCYSKFMLSQLLLGYAINIYKMQGSQSPYIILSTPQSHIYHMNRNLLYTGTSRTQKKCFHISNEPIIISALRKSAQFQRNTLLETLLRRQYKNFKETKEEQ